MVVTPFCSLSSIWFFNFQTRQIRTRAAAKKNASIGSSVSNSESDITITKQTSKTRAKSAEPGSKASKAITSSRSVSDLDKRNKLGSVSHFV